jgi:hypothetical protein
VPVKVTGDQMVMSYTRHAPASSASPEELFLVVLNLGGEAKEITLELSPAYLGPFNAVDALSGEGWPDVPASQPYAVKLAPASAVVLQLTPSS